MECTSQELLNWPIIAKKEKQELKYNKEAKKESINTSNNSNNSTNNKTNTTIYNHVTQIHESVDQHWNSGDVS